ncbi:seryl-tRNA synthetase [Rhodopirellula maiorica SM1]|uniref:Serine--tRNA ligase n=1 Tax=Rhodopirellula maiorica SM1 TaxID=1265738 RepID=M5RC31_9BACT|nr:serine--tRNA ligase [Rhodopirellula maiorica]EMI16626.1 seryl-tRNA synthetase [Rhodopirellula maiorica SM1]
MLDRKFIIQNAQAVSDNCKRRGVDCDIEKLVQLDERRLATLQNAQDLNRQANEVSKGIGGAKDADERQQMIEKGRQLREQKDAAQREHDELEQQISEIQALIPNLTHPDAPTGGEEDANELSFGKTAKPKFDFKPLDHLELGEKHDLFDFEAGARVAGAGFYFLRNAAVRLDLALQQFAVSFLSGRGFTPVSTPDLALTSVLQGTGFNPRGPETQIYSIENTELNLVATAEIPLGGMMSGQTLDLENLPIRLCGLSHCFRTEAGAAGRASKGLYRVHQFSKVEMFAFSSPDQSDSLHEEMRSLECEIFDQLEVPYRVIDTASGDLGGPAYRKYDLEAWMPGRGDAGEWGEVTSTSNCTDYQARRLNVRFKRAGQKGTEFVHTLNGTAVATGRAMIAIIENHQRADGSIAIPKVLQPWVGSEQIG